MTANEIKIKLALLEQQGINWLLMDILAFSTDSPQKPYADLITELKVHYQALLKRLTKQEGKVVQSDLEEEINKIKDGLDI